MRSARWISKSPGRPTGSPRFKWISRSRGSRSISCAKRGRLFILEKLIETIPEPRKELSKYAPRMIILQINPEKIKDVIGPGGKIINKIIADTGVKIDIEDDGRVFITSPDGEAGEKAKK